MNTFRVKFNLYGDKTVLKGAVIDRFSDIVCVEQRLPSGQGGFIAVEKFRMNTDFYKVLGDNGKTYNIRCSEVEID